MIPGVCIHSPVPNQSRAGHRVLLQCAQASSMIFTSHTQPLLHLLKAPWATSSTTQERGKGRWWAGRQPGRASSYSSPHILRSPQSASSTTAISSSRLKPQLSHRNNLMLVESRESVYVCMLRVLWSQGLVRRPSYWPKQFSHRCLMQEKKWLEMMEGDGCYDFFLSHAYWPESN